MLPDSPEARFAVAAVREAALLVRKVQAEMISPGLTKEDLSPVTVGDFSAQAIVARRLSESFPGDRLVGEEDAAALRENKDLAAQVTGFVRQLLPEASGADVCAWIDRGNAEPSGRFWTLDPIDGTKGFLRGEQYAVALALIVDGRVELGALGCPNLTDGHELDIGGPGSVLVAARGSGTWILPLTGEGKPRQAHVSNQQDPAQARILSSVEAGHTNLGQIDELAGALQVQAEPVRLDSQAKYAVLAAGGGELLYRLISPKRPDYKEKIWDQAAGSIVVEEAGGRITDLDGRNLDFTQGETLANNRGVLVSNGHLHEPALAALRQIGA